MFGKRDNFLYYFSDLLKIVPLKLITLSRVEISQVLKGLLPPKKFLGQCKHTCSRCKISMAPTLVLHTAPFCQRFMECIAALHAVRRKGVHGFEQFKFVLVQL
jgi:hypothetical protein